MRHSPITSAEQLMIAHIYRAGFSAIRIARAYRRPKQTILRSLVAQDVDRRNHAERKALYADEIPGVTKWCPGCKTSKPLAEFHKGQFICKACGYRNSMDWQRRHPDRARTLWRIDKRAERERKPDGQSQEEWREWYARNAEHRRDYQNAHRDPQKQRANRMALAAIRSGALVRPSTCSRCGKDCKPDAHHSDYNKPLEVEWVCRSCHRKIANPPEPGYLQPPAPTKR